MSKVHHSAICTGDLDASLRFWRDGLGFVITMDHAFEGDWPALFGAPSRSLRSVFLSEHSTDDSGVVELVDFGAHRPALRPDDRPAEGFFLLSLFVDLDATLDRLAALGVGGEPRRITVDPGVGMAVVRDPNGVLVELIDHVRSDR